MSIHSAVKPLRPSGDGWKRVELRAKPSVFPCQAWIHSTGLLVISAMEVADGIHHDRAIPQYHISISYRLGEVTCRCSPEQAAWVLEQFGAQAALEDNHGPLIRSFWMPVNESLRGADCACKEDEAAVVDKKDGFEWRPLTQQNYDRSKP